MGRLGGGRKITPPRDPGSKPATSHLPPSLPQQSFCTLNPLGPIPQRATGGGNARNALFRTASQIPPTLIQGVATTLAKDTEGTDDPEKQVATAGRRLPGRSRSTRGEKPARGRKTGRLADYREDHPPGRGTTQATGEENGKTAFNFVIRPPSTPLGGSRKLPAKLRASGIPGAQEQPPTRTG